MATASPIPLGSVRVYGLVFEASGIQLFHPHAADEVAFGCRQLGR
ncbi:hypothetical protein HMPREF0494_0714 [Limosilactobacillus antri DSM 16041]|uniref:Uncharacterized protein n=1 Tax=Limosilactobacillus antri DSM 16041 TaxID=525309 RepID=C8P5X0_9LACO|nr:hypothetical protein HMPREF0494_0714 [Limosilactobacillus antri DSM 16041]